MEGYVPMRVLGGRLCTHEGIGWKDMYHEGIGRKAMYS